MSFVTNSSQIGFLGPSGVFMPIEDSALDGFIETLISNVSGVPINFIRPRWVATPPLNLPLGQDWAAVGITEQDADPYVYTARDTTTNAIATIRQEDFTVACSFYGPDARLNASLLRDGMSVLQNSENLLLNGIGFTRCSTIMNMSTLINNQWYQRREIMIYFKRLVIREYPVLDILSSSGNVNDGTTSANYQTEAINS
jgi:hypothetical protein